MRTHPTEATLPLKQFVVCSMQQDVSMRKVKRVSSEECMCVCVQVRLWRATVAVSLLLVGVFVQRLPTDGCGRVVVWKHHAIPAARQVVADGSP